MSLAHHRLSIHLAHVSAPIGRRHVPKPQDPRSVSVRHADAVVLSDHVASDSEDGLCVNSEPCHLENLKVRNELGHGNYEKQL